MTTELELDVASIILKHKTGIDCINTCVEKFGTSYEFMELHNVMKSLWQLKLRGFLDYGFGKFKSNSKTLSLFDKEQSPCPKK